MGWLFIFFASITEITGVIGLKMFSQEKTFKSGALYATGFGLSFLFLYFAFQYLQVSVVYAVWIGIGTAGAVLVNMMFFGESRSQGRLVSVMLIIIGVVGLKAIA